MKPDIRMQYDCRDLTIEQVALSDLIVPNRSLRRHSDSKLAKLARNIETFGFLVPVVVDGKGKVLAGEARVQAARTLGLDVLPAVRVAHLTDEQARAFRIADNRLVELSDWDEDALRDELGDIVLVDPEFDLELTAFDTAELDRLLSFDLEEEAADPDDAVVDLPTEAVSRIGDVWVIGKQRIVCGDCSDAGILAGVLGEEACDLVVTDPPYNVPIVGHVRGSGAHEHREFVQASGEMTEDQFEVFLRSTLGPAVSRLRDGGLVYSYMDWRSIELLLRVGRSLDVRLINLAVWNKSNGGMGSLYRSKHELCAIWKKGTAPHTNNVQLGAKGRYRTNVWDYAGVNAFGHDRDEALAIHPTVKPVAMIADIIKDVTKRGELVLDPFAGSGTTLLAAERIGRRSVGIELDPLYVDAIVARLSRRLDLTAVHEQSGRSFEVVKLARAHPEGSAKSDAFRSGTALKDLDENRSLYEASAGSVIHEKDVPLRRRPPPVASSQQD